MPTKAESPLPIHMLAPTISMEEVSPHSWTDDLPVCHLSGLGLSTNQIYREDGSRKEEHEAQDRSFHFRVDEDTFFYGVFDGHDGSKAAHFAEQRMPAEVLLGQLSGKTTNQEVRDLLQQAFIDVEKGFFDSIDDLLAEKANLQLQLQGLSSYEAYRQYPEVVNRLQTVIGEISGGTTAVVALIFRNKLYVANVGDSRALLCKIDETGSPQVIQLSVDHDICNEDELLRLSQLGLDVEKIRQGSKLGNQETTRCIGNYMVKGGYKDFDILSVAKEEPVIAEPEIRGGIQLDSSCRFLLLMSDGLYKSLEQSKGTRQANLDIVSMVLEQFNVQSTLMGVAQAVVDKVVRIHHDTYMSGTEAAKRCQKRDDITLLIRNFNQPLPHAQCNSHPREDTVRTCGLIFTVGQEPATSEDTLATDQLYPSSRTNDDASSSESEEPERFQQKKKPPLPVDKDGRIPAYVDFTEYYRAVEEARQKGLIPPDSVLI